MYNYSIQIGNIFGNYNKFTYESNKWKQFYTY